MQIAQYPIDYQVGRTIRERFIRSLYISRFVCQCSTKIGEKINVDTVRTYVEGVNDILEDPMNQR